MLIRAEQVETLNKVPLRAFEDEMVAHLADFSPPLFKAIKEEQTRTAIRFGIARAERYGFTWRGPISLYLELMLIFGGHFDIDPQYPWANEILDRKDPNTQMERAEMLYEKVLEYQEKVIGPDDEYALKAMEGISDLARNSPPVTSENLEPVMLEEMARIYPQKTVYVGEAGLRALIHSAIATANRYSFSSVRARALPVILMFAFGHGCFDDPLYPWIAKTVRDGTITEPEAQAQRLEKRALTWLDHVIAYFEKDGKA
jgi:hypothetical protein